MALYDLRLQDTEHVLSGLRKETGGLLRPVLDFLHFPISRVTGMGETFPKATQEGTSCDSQGLLSCLKPFTSFHQSLHWSSQSQTFLSLRPPLPAAHQLCTSEDRCVNIMSSDRKSLKSLFGWLQFVLCVLVKSFYLGPLRVRILKPFHLL